MASNVNIPIPQNPIGENFVWRDWFQRLSNKVFGTAAALDVPILPQYGGTGQTTYTDGQLLIGDSVTNGLDKGTLTAGTGITITNGHGTISIAANSKWCGAFHDTTTQSTLANTPTALTLNTTDISNGVTIGTPASRIVVSTPAIYNLQISLQFSNTAAGQDDATLWIRKNGADLADSTSFFSIPAKHGAVDGHVIGVVTYLVSAVANDYFEFYWFSVGGTTTVETYPASVVAPVYPRVPGIILVVAQI